MALVAGTRLGVYEVVAPIGAGGMGEVYRAHDTKLGRDVAIKVLAESFAADPERVARFKREAQILAALNHPHIAAIYGLEEAAGGQFLIMELVEGPTIAKRLSDVGRVARPSTGSGRPERAEGRSRPAGAVGAAGHGLPVDETLRIARQVADALQAAHEKGIVHRDLKTANIALDAEGQVKVLDFGLAKALGPGEGSDDDPALTQSPTLSLAATQAGVILGTAAYMSPEQARGKPADKRSDIWAFGCVLYEMLTGTRPFQGEDISETLAFVLTKEPDWKALPAAVPAGVRTLLMRCMERDRRRRVADISTALFVLDEAALVTTADGPAEAGHYVRPGVGAGLLSRPGAPLWRRVATHATTVVVGAALAGAGVFLLMRPAPLRVLRTEVTTSGATALSIIGADRSIAITPDGSRIVYRGNGELLVRALDRIEPDVLSGLGSPRGVFVSPDGQWVGFFDGATLLKKVAITGGPPVSVSLADGVARGATWGPDGTIVYATSNPATGLQRVSAAGGDPTVLTKPDRERGESDHLWPEFLPGGQGVLFTIVPATGGRDNAQIAVFDFATGTSKVVVRGGHHAHYVPTGHLIYGVGGTLRAVAFDRDRLEVVGTPVPLLERVVTTNQGGVDVAVAANGTMVYVPGGGVAGAARSLVWVDRMGREEPVPAPERAYQYPRISPDGTRVALDVRDQDLDIWIWDFARLTFTRLTFDPGGDEYPVWMPDSRRVVFGSGPPNAQNLFWKAADGTGSAERLTESPNDQDPQSVTPDGNLLVFREIGPQGTVQSRSVDLMVLPLRAVSSSPGPIASGGASLPQVKPLLQTIHAEQTAEVSPGGQWLAYESNESGREEIYVRPFPDVESSRWQVSTGGGRTPLWSRNGQELFYVTPEAMLMGVRVDRGSSWRSSVPAKVLECACYLGTAGGSGRTFDIAPDGRRFLLIKQAGGDEAGPQNLVVVQNWTEELKRLVPAP